MSRKKVLKVLNHVLVVSQLRSDCKVLAYLSQLTLWIHLHECHNKSSEHREDAGKHRSFRFPIIPLWCLPASWPGAAVGNPQPLCCHLLPSPGQTREKQWSHGEYFNSSQVIRKERLRQVWWTGNSWVTLWKLTMRTLSIMS